MAINKNFVVKHGLEVATNLILADAGERKIGIGTTNPKYTVEVIGGIGVTDAYVSGIATIAVGVVTTIRGTNLNYSGISTIENLYTNVGFITSLYTSGIATVISEFNVGSGGTTLTVLGGNSVGVGTALPAYLLDVRSPVSTGQTALYVQGDVRITGDLAVDDLSFDDATVQNLTITDTLYVGGESGISTFAGYSTFNDSVSIEDNLQVGGISTFVGFSTFNNYVDIQDGLRVIGVSTFVGFSTFNDYVDIQDGLRVIGVSTFVGFSTFQDSVSIENDLQVTGITTLGVTTATDLTLEQLNVSGISTFTNGPVFIGSGTSTGTASQRLQVTGGAYVSGNVGLGTANSGSANIAVVNTADTASLSIGQNVDGTGQDHLGIWYGGTRGTGGANVFTSNGNLRFDVDGAGGSGSQIQFGWGLDSNQTQMVVNSTAVGIGTTIPDSKLTVYGDVRITGVSTLGDVKISTGIVTASSGIVTYYGDGSYLTGNARNLTATVGLRTEGSVVGYGISYFDLRGPGLSTVYYNNSVGIATIYFQGGSGSASIGIGSTPGDAFTGIVTAGNLWYNNNLGRLFIYYQDENSAQWVDASPFNVGVITSLNNVSFVPGSALSPSMYFSGDQTTGFFSPGAGEFTVVSLGSSVLNINPSGINVTGVATAQDFDALSDQNYKENVTTVNNALLKVEQMRGVKFNWKESGNSSYGVIAQELEQVLPELVHGNDPKTVNYNGIIGVLIEAIKELKAEVEELKNAK